VHRLSADSKKLAKLIQQFTPKDGVFEIAIPNLLLTQYSEIYEPAGLRNCPRVKRSALG
jgi:hypothetical protein